MMIGLGCLTSLMKNKNNLKIPPHLLAGEFFLLYICRIKIKNMENTEECPQCGNDMHEDGCVICGFTPWGGC